MNTDLNSSSCCSPPSTLLSTPIQPGAQEANRTVSVEPSAATASSIPLDKIATAQMEQAHRAGQIWNTTRLSTQSKVFAIRETRNPHEFQSAIYEAKNSGKQEEISKKYS